MAPRNTLRAGGPDTDAPAASTAALAALDPAAGPILPVAGSAPTLDPAKPDPVTNIPAVAAAPIGADLVLERIGTDPAGRPFVEQPPTDIGAFRAGHEGVSASTDGVHGRGTMVDGDRTETVVGAVLDRMSGLPRLPSGRLDLGGLSEADRLDLRNQLFGVYGVAHGPAMPLDLDEAHSTERAAQALDDQDASLGTITVACSTKRRRGGLAFGPTPVEIPLAALDRWQIEAIEGDPLLSVRMVRDGRRRAGAA